jgi:hypothetical protein
MPLSTGERLGPVQGIGWVPGIRRQWRDDGKQIVYVDLKGVLWAVDLDTGSTIQAGGAEGSASFHDEVELDLGAEDALSV